MKLKLHVVFPLLLVAVIAGGFLVLQKQSEKDGKTSRSSKSSPTNPGEPPGRLDTGPGTPGRDPSRTGAPSEKPTVLIDRLLSSRSPAEFGKVESDLLAVPLSPADIDRLRAIARGGASAHHRMIAINVLAKLQDPDGQTFAALKDAVGAGEQIVSHLALSQMRSYLKANPAAAGEVNAYLLGRAGSSLDEEFRSIAVNAIDVDTLKESDQRIFTGLLNDASEEIRCAAVHTLSRTSRKEPAFQTLANAFTTDPSERVKRHILSVLVEMGRDSRPTLVALKGRSRELDPDIDEALQNLDSPE